MYTVTIKKIETGEARECIQDLEWHEHSDFWWSEGNMACDCNRALEFDRAGNDERDFDEDYPCSDGKYSIEQIKLEDGTIINIPS